MTGIRMGSAGFLTLSLLAFSAISSTGHAAAPTSFYPAAGWDFSTVSGGDGQPDRCILMTEYNNGFLVQLQGKEGKIETISVDFRQAAFKRGQAIPVIMSIPGSGERKLQGRAFQAEVVAANLKGNDDLFGALRGANAFDLKIGDNDFRFILSGFSNALPAFDRCMNNGQGAVSASVSAAPPLESTALALDGQRIVPAPEITVQQDEGPRGEGEARVTAALQKELEQAQGAPSAVENKTANNAGQAEPAADRYAAMLADQMGAEAAQKSALSGGHAQEVAAPASPAPENPDSSLRSSTPPALLPSPSSDSPDSFDMMDGDMQGEFVPEGAAIDAPPPEPVRTRISTPQMKVNKEQGQIEADFSKPETIPARMVEPAPAVPPTFDGAASGNAFAAGGGAIGSGEIKRDTGMEKRVASLEAENAALNDELNRALKASEKELLEVSSKNWNLEQATMRYNEAERQIARLGQEIQKERAQCTYEKKELELMLFDPQLTDQAQLARLARLEDELAAARAEIAVLKGGTGN